ncbi:acetyl esterase [Polynucleobacter kasalickyi]|uniref:Acetyl esterase n=1 Tax=Polynucleobacter kasalickyi TaxID=1938817 RepID=A0A1W2BWD5_9BURK|nr:acetyl esterase [Polynucleobacter kasalickyi]
MAIQNEMNSNGLGAPDIFKDELALARKQIANQYTYLNRDFVHQMGQLDLRIPYLDELVNVRCYFPYSIGTFQSNTLLIYLHGGGWSFGDDDTHHAIAASFAKSSGLTLASIAYSLAPQKKHPYQNHECTYITEKLLNQFRNDYGSELNCILIGDSAGANLALSSYLHLFDDVLKKKVVGMALFYGVYDSHPISNSWNELGDGTFGLSIKAMNWYWDQFLSKDADRLSSLAAPINSVMENLPPIWMAIGDLDPLIDENLALVKKITASGGSSECLIVPGYTHGFLRFCNQLKEVKEAIEKFAKAINIMAQKVS